MIVGNNYLSLSYPVITCNRLRLYIKRRFGAYSCIQQMEERTVKDLCRRIGIPQSDLLLPCSFCSRFLTQEELYLFDAKRLSLLWRRGCAHGLCTRCQRASAALELALYHQGYYTAHEINATFGDSIADQNVRCFVCYAYLPRQQVSSLVEAQQSFLLVRGSYRALCDLC